MADLLVLLPKLSVRLHVVAMQEMREQFRQELLRPTFLSLKPRPLRDVCSFIPYWAVEEINAMPNLEYMKDAIVDKYRVAFGEDEDI